MTVNKVILVGNLGADPEVREARSGTTICGLRIATSERRKDASGEWTDHTEWHRVTAFGKTAETCARYLQKGRQVYVEGRIETQKYQDKEGRDKYSTQVIASAVRFLSSGQNGASDQKQPARRDSGAGYSGPGGMDDGIPF